MTFTARERVRATTALVSAGAMLLLAQPAFAQDAAEEGAAGSGGLEEIVVTARRQSENLQSTPVAVTALSTDQMEARAMTDLRDIARFTPNVYFSTVGAQSPDQSAVSIRGVGLADAFATTDPAVGMYIDGVYYARAQGGVMDLLDIDRIEVLRGPQGTLFGKNTSGGAVNIISQAPDPDGGGRVSLTVGNLGRIEVAGSADIGFGDNFAVKISGLSKNRGCLWRRDYDRACFGAIDRTAGRIYAQYKPTSDLTFSLIGDITRGRSTSRPHHIIDYDPTVGVFARHNGFVGTPGYGGTPYTLADPGIDVPRYYSTGDLPTATPLNAGGVSFQIEWDLGGATLHSISSYRHADALSQEESFAKRNGLTGVISYSESDWYSQEFRVDGTLFDDKLDYIAGLYYFYEDGVTNEAVNSYRWFNFGRVNYNRQKTNSYAAFAHLSYNLTERLRLSAGLRYTHETKDWTAKFVQFQTILPLDPGSQPYAVLRWDPTPFPNVLEDGSTAFTQKSVSSSPVTPKFGIDFQATDDLLLFANISKGFRSGGFNGRSATVQSAQSPYRPEFTTSYEAGFKAELFDRRVRLNATGFYTDYQDLQQTVLLAVLVNGVNFFSPIVTNAASAKIWGGEAELTALIADRLRIEGNLGYTHARYSKVDPAATAATGLNSNSVFPNVPEFTAAAALSYEFETPFGTITPRVDYTYRSEVYFRIDSRTYGSGQPPSPRSTTPGVSMVNATLTFKDDDDKWNIQLYGRNLTNKVYNLFMNDLTKVGNSTGTLIAPSDPREYGITVTRRF